MIYPNPANDELRIQKVGDHRVEAIEVRDLKGRTVREYGVDQRSLKLRGLSEGAYLLRVRTSEGIRVKRFLVQ